MNKLNGLPLKNETALFYLWLHVIILRPQGRVTRGGRGRGGNRGKRPNGAGRCGRRAPQKQRMCEDCEENAATQFCADCQPPLVLCDNCALVLHRGVTRRNHQLKGKVPLRNFNQSRCMLWYILYHQFAPTLPTPGTTDTDFVDTFLVFRKGVLLLITTYCINYVFLHALIFYQPVWTPKATFQTVENNFLDRASIFRQLTFITFHRTNFTLQQWTGKC